MKRYFITGTDTDCGKTYVTRQLIAYFPHAAAIKPVASGCSLINDELVSSDAQQLLKKELTLQQINPWRFQLPVSPHIAAEHAGSELSVSELSDYCLNFSAVGINILFVEGAGGLMVPLNARDTWVDFLHHTQMPVILIVGMKLGCINHALLTETALKANGIKCAGWIANCLNPEMLALEENIETLRRKLDAPLLSILPFSGEFREINLEEAY